jgi:hypothetical protein
MRMKPALLLLAFGGLSACSTAIENCVRAAEVPYREALERRVDLEHLLHMALQSSEDSAAVQRTPMNGATADRMRARDHRRNYVATESFQAELKRINDALPRLEAQWKADVEACHSGPGALDHLISPMPAAVAPADDSLPVILVDDA